MTAVSRIAALLPDRVFCTAVAVAHRRFEPEMRDIVRACDPDGTAVDVGAWFGPWAHWLARRVDHVVCFEANPAVAAVLRRSAAANVTVHDVALSDAAGSVELSVSGGGLGAEGRSSLHDLPDATSRISVPAATLDSFALDRVRLVKIDVEGHEYAVIRGARQLLETWHPVVVAELEERHGDVGPTIEHLRSLGYAGRVKSRGEWKDLDDFDLVASQRAHVGQVDKRGYLHNVITPAPGYVNNVVFTHRDSTWSPW